MTNWTRLEAQVVTIAHPQASELDRASAVPVARAGSPRLPHRANVAALNAQALRVARGFRPDVVLSAHIVCAPGAAALRRLGVPTALYVHADEVSASPSLAAFALGRADLVIAVSEYARALAEQAGAPPARVRVVHNGTDLPAQVRRKPSVRPQVLTIASMLKRYKGHDVMIRALPLIRARVPDVEWVVVGSGELEPLYRDMVAQAGLGAAVRFCGFVDARERAAALDGADVFAMPSRLRPGGGGGEGFGIVYLEAGAHGVPVVGGNVAGALDAVRHGETGLLVDPTDHVQVADAITELLLDSRRAEAMGTAGRAWAEQHDWPRVAAQVEDLLHGLA